MRLWVIVLILGATACGWLFLKARQNDIAGIYRKVGKGTKGMKRVAERVAKRPSIVEPYMAPTSEEEVQMSKDLAGQVAKDLEEIMEKKNL